MDVKEKCLKIVVFYLAKSFTERLETSEFHKSNRILFFTFFINFCQFSYSCDDWIAQKAAVQEA